MMEMIYGFKKSKTNNKRLRQTNFRCHLFAKTRIKAGIRNLLGELSVKNLVVLS